MSALVAKLADALDSGSSGATLGGSNPLERSEASERFHLPVAINDWARGGCAGAKIYRATTRASDPSGTGGLIEGGNGSEKALGVRVGGVGRDGFRWALLNKFAMFKDGDLIADVFYDG